ncbi:MAG: hypothetical protein E7620_08710 [Ruminococcaceae bacterium]|nr:hypothetical protein [Oscillospiraceae bacterium]
MENDPQKTPDLSAMLSSLLSNPELMGRIKSAVEASQTNTAQSEAVSVAAPNTSSATTANPLNAVLSSPELMAKLPQILATVKPLMETATSPQKEPHKLTEAEKRYALLMALKPFLSPERCRTLDAILQISQLGSAARQLL